MKGKHQNKNSTSNAASTERTNMRSGRGLSAALTRALHWKPAHKVLASLVGAVLLVALVVAGSFWAFRQIGKAAATREHSYDLISRANNLLSALKDAETGQRGYLLTGDEAFLEPYVAVRYHVGGQLEELRRLTLIEAAHKHLDTMVPLVAAKMAEMARVIELRRNHDLTGVLAAVNSGRGKRLMDSIRAETGSYIQLEQIALAQHEATFQSDMHRLFVIIVVVNLLTVLLAFSCVYLIYREAESRIKKTSVLQNAIFNSARFSSIATDAKGVIQIFNVGAARMLGYDAAEVVNQITPADISDPQEVIARAKALSRELDCAIAPGFEALVFKASRGIEDIYELTYIRKDGSRFPAIVSVTALRDERDGIIGYLLIGTDNSVRKQAEAVLLKAKALQGALLEVEALAERRRLEAQLIEAQKMEVIGKLAGGVAHDFNNILGVIMGYSEMLASGLAPNSLLRKYTEEIRHASVRAAGLTRQLLVFSRKQTVQPVVLDLNEVVKDLNKMLRRLIDENIEMTVVPGKHIGRVKADPGYIGQVLMNLVVNARDAMPNGGKLTIATNNVVLDENYTRTHPNAVPGEYVMLSVSDTGTGMTDEVKAHMFEAFFTTKPLGKGTGLGLATCQTIAQQSGGHIGVYSELGKGTSFKIYFPQVELALDVAARPIQTGPLPRGTETLLIVEDEPSVRHLARQILQTQGYEVLSASNGQDALQVAREHIGPPIRLVVTDVIMPLMSGKVMADRLKTTDPELKVLFTSGYTDDAIAQHGMLEPGVAFLPKPYTPANLTRKVRAMLDNETDTNILWKQDVAMKPRQ